MIPADVTAQMQTIQGQIAAATPLVNAPRATLMAIQLNVDNLMVELDALIAAPSVLDAPPFTQNPVVIASQILNVSQTATNQSDLALVRGIVGRADANLDSLGEPQGDPD